MKKNKGATAVSKNDIEKLTKEAEKWAASGDGKKALEEAFRCAKETVKELSMERFVDAQIMRMPLTS